MKTMECYLEVKKFWVFFSASHHIIILQYVARIIFKMEIYGKDFVYIWFYLYPYTCCLLVH